MSSKISLTSADRLALIERALDYANCGVLIADAGRKEWPLVYVNDAFTEITGYSVEEAMGLKLCSVVEGEASSGALSIIHEGIREQKDCRILVQSRRKDGTAFWNELSISPVCDEADQCTHLVCIQTDATEREDLRAESLRKQQAVEKALEDLRSAQASLVHSEKMTALGQLVAGVAHEVNNPISFVTSNVHSLKPMLEDALAAFDELALAVNATGSDPLIQKVAELRKRYDLDFVREDYPQLFASTINGLQRVKTLVEDLRQFSRIDEAERKKVDLSECLESTLILTRGMTKSGIEIKRDFAGLPPIECYPAELNQVFLNIVLNAVDAMDGKGCLSLRIFGEANRQIVEISDTGPGIPAEALDQVFEPFFTTKSAGKGTGLGLAISHKIVTVQHRGVLSVHSEPGHGATFRIELPIVIEVD